ncbi:imidazolonepropionase [Nitratireductor aquimarinus]|uniref:imidazolonepropionase n=1 Tax=Nitratireductor aquimarinus TaxID=889300 RepID=UPI001A8EE975|nr:imidazolonepropionase [Nitratireductor aquimarinus]MBN8244265.1 imidazolonepropionase [Nitratireductor aquimarinus]MBY6132655.1 imidazolonepropionase [Nitratireductor aquimarinus]MCA1304542.1 imidazolonepropionase [Nitratireductor aquimarinus]
MKQSVISGIRLASMCEGGAPYGLVEDAGIAIEGDMIVWAGAMSNLPERFSVWERTDFGGRLATPALVDCHTHLVFGGNRAREFEMRLEGASYEEVARAGGGIVSTVSATRGLDEDALVEDALKRLDALLAEGVATVEVKSGYGLTIEDELKMLRAARRLAELRPVRIKTSYLAAHAVPAEYRGREDAYIDAVVLPGMDAAHAEGLVDAVDGFCEGIAFSPAQMARVFDRARELGLPVKLHAEQLSNLGGAKMAASYGALSADHLEYLDEEGVAAMAASGTVAVLLPGAFYTLRETQYPPLAALRKHGVRIAVATDCNPGSSPLASLLLTVNMACTLFRMTPEEALVGATREGARALGLAGEIGTIEAGKRAEIAIWDVEHPAELAYRIGFNPLHRRIAGDFA